MAKKPVKVHWHLTAGLGQCGYHGETTKDRGKVTCKFCKKMIKRLYPKGR